MKPITMTDLNQLKNEKRKFATITAYDASFAHLFAEQGIDVMLVGDSLGMTVQGADTTIPVTVEDTVYHTRCVRAGAPYTFIIADMPFMSYATPEQSCENAAKLMRAGANMVKLEGGSWLYDTISMLTERSVPVCAHLGLTPQSVHILGGYRVQGRDEESANQLIKDAITLEKAGIQLLVLECVPVDLAKRITDELQIPVIGIGAGNVTDGQILVMHDVLGITVSPPKFVKNFLEEAGNIPDAIRLYKEQVESGAYPGKEHSFY
ncbi:3-methyl-2-oxobutanoate hydroxymethyltransferase [Photorhabdus luminescens]|uniref:3-methyl-2-oxobutanoate hydroxymethyltransferase n=1 Tax=Photorhabdus akhurstii TaxID=171438 RepID=A0ABX8LPN4_9GAMM|nr:MULTISPECIES: 3-methyl-2-oxobutanoate hydroxymethyltransferase [Photorhabdus]KGM28770.1 3-methyl-2-oxobutanoate hydroxymethyltransferase [Photorhabdus luminescens]MCC8456477.1 3-methyl-2-oxobutanoate hydroxymethyltransferase [Photorhabdus aegyptia]PQQ39703.1 3-methyl-2-oxobutanoate hydroxymethyltransferase [Photorhabdus luminescens]QXF32535.1 3-methyl-2-oxobutanoate hydroxymethyltransferase [Photorhabdus akhurstii]UJD74330.1 3-methyl-2-oxobutanoate hydroxymethyltransferase [Photorhabdus lum